MEKEYKPKRRKNVSQTIPNGTLIITNDSDFEGTDYESTKTRMATVVDSNRKNELAIVKYTKSKKHGRKFENDKGIIGHGDKIYIEDDKGNPIKVDNVKFSAGPKRRKITYKQANEIKRRNIKESRYKSSNMKKLRDLKKK